ncbi:MAG: deoxyribodipyrimidine photolyase [Syntrophobacteraceae bacterium]
MVPLERVISLNAGPVNPRGDFVLYWMTAFRRARWNFSLERAVQWAVELGKPLLVLEALRCDYPWASDRLHTFILQGMRDNRERFGPAPAFYYPYVETGRGEGKGLLRSLASTAALVVTDLFPAFFLPRMARAAAEGLPVKMEAVDSNGLLPLAAAGKVFSTALAFRKFLQKELPGHMGRFPKENPLEGISLPRLEGLPSEVAARWPEASEGILRAAPDALAALPIDHGVQAVETRGGTSEAEDRLEVFLERNVHRYHEERNHPDEGVASGLSPYLHFGHISVHEIFDRLRDAEDWSADEFGTGTSGARAGWWGMSEGAEAFLDQLVTWRELGFNMCFLSGDYDRFESLPEWARKELAAHRGDERPHLYTLETFESAGTDDPVWNAAQRELLQEGTIRNYLRMLWGKKILEWTASPEEALEVMIELNNRYALDGRDPNSYTGIFWVLGRYDRPFGPPRRVFGTVRYMSSASAVRKLKMEEYLHCFGDGE